MAIRIYGNRQGKFLIQAQHEPKSVRPRTQILFERTTQAYLWKVGRTNEKGVRREG